MNNWISVKDGMPEKFKRTLVSDGQYVTFGYYGGDGWIVYNTNEELMTLQLMKTDYVDYWMDIEPPEL